MGPQGLMNYPQGPWGLKKQSGREFFQNSICWLLVIGYWYWLLVFVSPPGGGPVINFARPYVNLNFTLF